MCCNALQCNVPNHMLMICRTPHTSGILVGHAYYFFEDIYPAMADLHGWTGRRPLQTPSIMYVGLYVCRFCCFAVFALKLCSHKLTVVNTQLLFVPT
jgi:hypothetical protein